MKTGEVMTDKMAARYAREAEVLNQIDGHYCPDWDYLEVSARTPEYDCCLCTKTRLGRLVNWFYMLKFNWRMNRVMKQTLKR